MRLRIIAICLNVSRKCSLTPKFPLPGHQILELKYGFMRSSARIPSICFFHSPWVKYLKIKPRHRFPHFKCVRLQCSRHLCWLMKSSKPVSTSNALTSESPSGFRAQVRCCCCQLRTTSRFNHAQCSLAESLFMVFKPAINGCAGLKT